MSFCETIAKKLSEQQIISSEDEEIYAYGMWQGFLFLLNLATVVVLGFLFKMVWQSLFFTACYGSVRIFAGGYHTRTPLRCYFFSMALTVSVLLFVKYAHLSNSFMLIVLWVSFLVIFFLSPVEDENKPLDAKEFSVYRKRSRLLLSFWTGVCLLTYFVKAIILFKIIVVSMLTLSFMLALGKIRNIIITDNFNKQ